MPETHSLIDYSTTVVHVTGPVYHVRRIFMLIEPVYIYRITQAEKKICAPHTYVYVYIHHSLSLSTSHQFPKTASEFSIIQLMPSTLYESQMTELPLVSRKTLRPTPPPSVAL